MMLRPEQRRRAGVRIDELVELLRCLLGYAEMRIRNGDGAAPRVHAEEARRLLAKIDGTEGR